MYDLCYCRFKYRNHIFILLGYIVFFKARYSWIGTDIANCYSNYILYY